MSGISAMFPPAPTFTDSSISDLTGKIFLITGSTAGVGLALSGMLYSKSATVYICGRTIKKANEAISTLKSQHSSSRGTLKPLAMDLGDFDSVKLAAETVLRQDEELHILVHNAGVMEPPEGSKSISVGLNHHSAAMSIKQIQSLMGTCSSRDMISNLRQIVWALTC